MTRQSMMKVSNLPDSINEKMPYLVSSLQTLCLEAEAGNMDSIIRQQLETTVQLFKHFVNDPDESKAPAHTAGWLRLVVLQHKDRFPQLPFENDVLTSVWKGWKSQLFPILDEQDREKLNRLLVLVNARLTQKNEATIRVLFIGDCLLWDAATQLQILSSTYGFDIEPTILAQRLPIDLRKAIKQASLDRYDVIFFSPFSYEFSSEYVSVTSHRNVFSIPAGDKEILNEAFDEVQRTITVLAKSFNSPIYIHNTSGVRQTKPGWRGKLIDAMTGRQRSWAVKTLNRRLDTFIKDLSTDLFNHVHILNELEPLSRHSRYKLGQIIFDAGELHQTSLAQELASGPYLRACRVSAHLSKRKLIVCDLDNTLWDGVIGDGAVLQHLDRQRAILRLKAKGILLAVSSKNDPTNVRWNESLLSPEDFVIAEINWGQKVSNIRKIANVLNLNSDSFVFLDDRPDERGHVSEALPGVLTLDPNEDETWVLISEWEKTIDSSALSDRTTLYRERAQRQSHIESEQEDDEDLAAAYRKLGLKVSLRSPNSKEISRVVELINRTNQFNTTTARTTTAEMTEPNRKILIAEASDRFGDMGIVSVLVITELDGLSISHFVLSCRVFGFGIEDAVLTTALGVYKKRSLKALLVETPVNAPCRDVYARNGFIYENDLWVSNEESGVEYVDWLTIDDQVKIS